MSMERCSSWGSSNMSHVPNKPNMAATCPRKSSNPALSGVLIQHVSTPTCKGLISICHGLCQRRPDEGVLLLLLCTGSSQKAFLPLPSQRPSDGLFSPMEVRTDHPPHVHQSSGTCPPGMVLHIKSYALQGLISPKNHGNVNHISSLNLSNMHA